MFKNALLTMLTLCFCTTTLGSTKILQFDNYTGSQLNVTAISRFNIENFPDSITVAAYAQNKAEKFEVTQHKAALELLISVKQDLSFFDSLLQDDVNIDACLVTVPLATDNQLTLKNATITPLGYGAYKCSIKDLETLAVS